MGGSSTCEAGLLWATGISMFLTALDPAGTGKLELMGGCSADVVGLDWATDISAARAALGPSRPVQVGRRVRHARLHACSSAHMLSGSCASCSFSCWCGCCCIHGNRVCSSVWSRRPSGEMLQTCGQLRWQLQGQALHRPMVSCKGGWVGGAQGNVDPMMLFAPPDALRAEVVRCCRRAGRRGHILNVGHGVVQVRMRVLGMMVLCSSQRSNSGLVASHSARQWCALKLLLFWAFPCSCSYDSHWRISIAGCTLALMLCVQGCKYGCGVRL